MSKLLGKRVKVYKFTNISGRLFNVGEKATVIEEIDDELLLSFDNPSLTLHNGNDSEDAVPNTCWYVGKEETKHFRYLNNKRIV